MYQSKKLLRIVILASIILAVSPGTSLKAATQTCIGPLIATVPASECQALLDLYDSTNGSTWTNRAGWDTNTDVCTWNGVVCNGGTIQQLLLSANNLSGPLPATISDLTGLQLLYLNNNQLTGTIPDLSPLASLRVLYLHQNQLSGGLNASSFPMSIEDIYLTANQLTGNIPDFSSHASLRYLLLNNNQFNGTIDGTLFPGSLQSLNLISNQLSGPVPANLNNGLRWLNLNNNQFSGNLPALPLSLLSIGLSNNQLVGPIPNYSGLPALMSINLETNQLTGTISAAQLPLSLRSLNINNNQISGSVPDLSAFNFIQSLEMGNNQLAGPIPPMFGGLPNLSILRLSNNQLDGPVPDFSGNITLFNLYLDNNQLTGPFPATLPASLNILNLSNNQLSGDIPNLPGLTTAPGLGALLVNNNLCLTATDPNVNLYVTARDPIWFNTQTCNIPTATPIPPQPTAITNTPTFTPTSTSTYTPTPTFTPSSTLTLTSTLTATPNPSITPNAQQTSVAATQTAQVGPTPTPSATAVALPPLPPNCTYVESERIDDDVLEGYLSLTGEHAPSLWIYCVEPPDQIVLPPIGRTCDNIWLIDCDPDGNCKKRGYARVEEDLLVFNANLTNRPSCDGGCTFACLDPSSTKGQFPFCLIILGLVGLVSIPLVFRYVSGTREEGHVRQSTMLNTASQSTQGSRPFTTLDFSQSAQLLGEAVASATTFISLEELIRQTLADLKELAIKGSKGNPSLVPFPLQAAIFHVSQAVIDNPDSSEVAENFEWLLASAKRLEQPNAIQKMLPLNQPIIITGLAEKNALVIALSEAFGKAGIPAHFASNSNRAVQRGQPAISIIFVSADLSETLEVQVRSAVKKGDYVLPAVCQLPLDPETLPYPIKWRLENQVGIDFTGRKTNFSIDHLLNYLAWLQTPDGQLHALQIRLADVEYYQRFGGDIQGLPSIDEIRHEIERLRGHL